MTIDDPNIGHPYAPAFGKTIHESSVLREFAVSWARSILSDVIADILFPGAHRVLRTLIQTVTSGYNGIHSMMRSFAIGVEITADALADGKDGQLDRWTVAREIVESL